MSVATKRVARPAKGKPSHPVERYARDVVEGRTIAGPWVRLAAQRHLEDLATGAARGLRFDAKRADHATEFFPGFLRLTGEGQFDGEPFALQPWQRFIVGSLFGWIGADGFRRYQHAYIECGKGAGKALSLDTEVPTPTGWTTMGALQPGDVVFDERGIPTPVLFVTDPMHGHPCYRVAFSDGAEIIADAEHLWRTHALKSGRRPGEATRGVPKREWRRWQSTAIRTTEEIAETLTPNPTTSRYPQAKWNHRVDLAESLDLPSADLPIPPYTLGAWLGDGDSASARLALPADKAQIADEIRADGLAVEVKPCPDRVDRAYLIGLRPVLSANGLLGAKHIPAAYLRASRGQRAALLQGLMDTDGSCDKLGRCEFSTTTRALADGVVELLRTLGYKPSLMATRAKLYGRDCGPAWRIQFAAYADGPCFRLQRKAARLRARPPTRPPSSGRMIVACEPTESVPVKCIKVAAESGLFLAGRHFIPTHNTPLLAGVLLYGLLFDEEPGAQIVCAARAREQARLMFDDCLKMARASVLADRLDINKNNILDLSTGSWIRPVSAEAQTLEGKRIHMAGIDEIWTHPSADVVNAIRKGTKARRQPLILEITNSGYDRTSVCWDHHEYSIAVVRGAQKNDAWFGFVCGLDEGDDPFASEACWPKANPNLDVSLPAKYLRGEVERARGMPSETGELLRKNFCVWTQQQTRFIPIDRWVATTERVADADLVGLPCWGGLDLGQSDDFSSGLIIWRLDDGRVVVRARHWIPEAACTKRPERPYDVWRDAGSLTITEGDTTDYDRVEDEFAAWVQAAGCRDVGYDKRFAEQMAQHLEGAGIDMVDTGQGFQLNEALRTLLDLVMTGKLIHEGEPVLTWMADNLVVRTGTRGEVRPDKPAAKDKIDGIVALTMAIDRMIRTPQTTSIYDERLKRGEAVLTVV